MRVWHPYVVRLCVSQNDDILGREGVAYLSPQEHHIDVSTSLKTHPCPLFMGGLYHITRTGMD